MDFLDLAKSRYSCRSFDVTKEIEQERARKTKKVLLNLN